MEVGRISGRLGSLEARVERTETAVWSELRGIRSTLDDINTKFANQAGESKGRVGLLHWIATGIGIVGAWFGASHWR